MAIGREPKPERSESPSAEKIIGNSAFGITLLSINKTMAELKKDLRQVNDAFTLPLEDFTKQFPNQEAAKRTYHIFEGIKSRNEAILAVSPEKILQSLQEIYDFVIELEKGGLNEKDILSKIKNEKPDLVKLISLYGYLLENTDWGTNINHGLLHK